MASTSSCSSNTKGLCLRLTLLYVLSVARSLSFSNPASFSKERNSRRQGHSPLRSSPTQNPSDNDNSVAMSLRRRLLGGAKSYGPVIMSNSEIVVELLAQSGYDHMVIDHEHSPAGIESGQRLLQAMDAASAFLPKSSRRAEPIVRLPGYDPDYMKKVLDSMRLPAGVLVPMVEDAEIAKQVVQSTRYPTQQRQQLSGSFHDIDVGGIRGCAVPFIRASGWGRNPNYLEQCREDLLVMVQVETPQGIDAIPDIAAIDGIDAIFLGPFDLSCSVGKMGDFQDSEVQTLIQEAERAVRESPCMLAGFRPSNRSLEEMFEAGYSLVSGSIDLGLLREAARQDVEAARIAMR